MMIKKRWVADINQLESVDDEDEVSVDMTSISSLFGPWPAAAAPAAFRPWPWLVSMGTLVPSLKVIVISPPCHENWPPGKAQKYVYEFYKYFK